MHTYEMRYLGEVLDQENFETDAEARKWRADFCARLMADEMPGFLGSGDFENLADCIKSIGLLRYKN